MAGTRYHVGIVKPYLLTLLRDHGSAAVLRGWQGTDEEAIDVIADDPRDVFVLDEYCDRQGRDGSCLGHRVE